MSVTQNIKTKRRGLRCEVQVMNSSGHDVLTTYDREVDNSVEVATEDLQRFMDECINEFRTKGSGLTPNVWGRSRDNPSGEMDQIDVKADGFSVEPFTQITVMPVPLTGG